MEETKKLCEYCHKSLRTIGNLRSNGKSHNDWKTRKLHKKCWKELKDYQSYYDFISKLKNEIN